MKHTLHILAASLLAVGLASCGGNGGGSGTKTSTVIAFGDSLTDGGTYKNGILAVNPSTGAITTVGSIGGGKFTTNGPNAKTWAEVVAESVGATASFGPAAGEGLSQGYRPNVGMFNYAQGGSKVTITNANAATATSETSVTTQISRHLAAYPSFNNGQLVILSAGANDIFQSNGDAAKVITAAKELAAQAARLQNAGSYKLLVTNLPDIGRTPYAISAGAATAAGSTQLTQLFNSELKKALDAQSLNSYLLLDVYAWNKGVLDNPSANGLSNITGRACNYAMLPQPSSLFCSSATLVAPNADMTYAFADEVHPTTKLHQLFGAYAISQIKAQGW